MTAKLAGVGVVGKGHIDFFVGGHSWEDVRLGLFNDTELRMVVDDEYFLWRTDLRKNQGRGHS